MAGGTRARSAPRGDGAGAAVETTAQLCPTCRASPVTAPRGTRARRGTAYAQGVTHRGAPPAPRLVLVALAVALAVAALPTARSGKPRDWSKFRESDLDTVDAQWRDGDAEEELITEDELEVRRMEERREKAPQVSPEQLETLPQYVRAGRRPATPPNRTRRAHQTPPHRDALEFIKQQEAQAGPTMMFAALSEVNPETGEPFTDDDRNELAYQWRDVRRCRRSSRCSHGSRVARTRSPAGSPQLLATDGITVTCYDIGENRILSTLQHGWRGFDLLRFLLAQPSTTEVEWNQHTYREGDHIPEDWDEFERLAKAKQRRNKKGKRRRRRKSSKGSGSSESQRTSEL